MTALSPDRRNDPPAWHEAAGRHRLFGGTSPIRSCEAHFHETYIIGFVRVGRALTRVNGTPVDLEPGVALFVNPYEIVECEAEPGFDYDVCYPDAPFMREAMALATGQSCEPRFASPVLHGSLAGEVGQKLASLHSVGDTTASGKAEHELLLFFRDHPELLCRDEGHSNRPAFVENVCELIEQRIEEPMSIGAISDELSCNRSYLARTFRDAVGLPPNIYARQLRLARALERVRAGDAIADIAVQHGFYDQSHFTREFKRVYGTTPGRLARDVSRCRHCDSSDDQTSAGSLRTAKRGTNIQEITDR